jgi:RNA polymerase sigma factor (sigma-70 family)
MGSDSSPEGFGPFDEIFLECLHQAIDRAFRRYHHQPRHDEVADLGQEICLSLIKNDYGGLKSFDPQKGEIAIWLRSIANHAALHCLQARENVRSLEGLELDAFACPPTQEDEVLFKERRCQLQRLRDRLSPKDRHMLELLLEEGLKEAEKAELLMLSPAAFRKRKHDFIHRLRHIVRGEKLPRAGRKRKTAAARVAQDAKKKVI